MNIKEAETRSGVSRQNIRFYERQGLLSPARDPSNDYRDYTDADVRTLKRIRLLRTLDMPLETIRGELPLPEAAARRDAQTLRFDPIPARLGSRALRKRGNMVPF